MTHLERIAVRVNIAEAIGGKYFNLCGIDKACGVLKLPTYCSDDYVLAQALHMVRFDEFDTQAKQELVNMVGRILHLDPNEHPTCGVAFLPSSQVEIT